MKVSYHGHAIIRIESKGKSVIIDPFINGNSLTDLKVEDVKVDYIILTHAHNDHVGDTVEIAKNNDALVIANADLATYLGWQGIRTHGMNIGGAFEFDFGTVKMTQAFHGSGYTTDDKQIIYGGMPAGVLVMSEGKTIYHAGDTGLFSDMKLLARHNIDLAFLPIGDNFTMGPEDAAVAAGFTQAKKVVPIHFNTFPPIRQNPQTFVDMLEDKNGIVLEPGEALEI